MAALARSRDCKTWQKCGKICALARDPQSDPWPQLVVPCARCLPYALRQHMRIVAMAAQALLRRDMAVCASLSLGPASQPCHGAVSRKVAQECRSMRSAIGTRSGCKSRAGLVCMAAPRVAYGLLQQQQLSQLRQSSTQTAGRSGTCAIV